MHAKQLKVLTSHLGLGLDRLWGQSDVGLGLLYFVSLLTTMIPDVVIAAPHGLDLRLLVNDWGQEDTSPCYGHLDSFFVSVMKKCYSCKSICNDGELKADCNKACKGFLYFFGNSSTPLHGNEWSGGCYEDCGYSIYHHCGMEVCHECRDVCDLQDMRSNRTCAQKCQAYQLLLSATNFVTTVLPTTDESPLPLPIWKNKELYIIVMLAVLCFAVIAYIVYKNATSYYQNMRNGTEVENEQNYERVNENEAVNEVEEERNNIGNNTGIEESRDGYPLSEFAVNDGPPPAFETTAR